MTLLMTALQKSSTSPANHISDKNKVLFYSQKPEMLTHDCPPAHVNDIYPNVPTGADKSRLILPKTSEVRGAAQRTRHDN